MTTSKDENTICFHCGYSIVIARFGEFAGKYVHVLTGNALCAMSATAIKDENTICFHCGYSIVIARFGEFAGKYVHVLTGNALCAMSATAIPELLAADLSDDLIAIVSYLCGQLQKLKTSVQQHRDVAGRDGTRTGKERSFAYDSALQLINRFFPDMSSTIGAELSPNEVLKEPTSTQGDVNA